MKFAKALAVSSMLLLGLSACSPESIARKIREMSADKTPPPVAVTPAPVPTAPIAPLPPAETSSAPSPTPVAPELSSEEKDRALQEEVNGYIQCMNRTSSRVQSSRDRYLSWVSEKAGPTCKEAYITYGLYTLYPDAVELCQKAAQKGQPDSAMQKSAAELAAAYAELVPLTQKASDYYQQQDYKDDACAKAKQMHPQLLAAFTRYTQAQSALEASIASIKTDLDQKELARLEQQQGKRLPWQVKNLMIQSEKLIRSFPKDPQSSLSAAAYLVAYPLVEGAYNSWLQYSEANPQEGKDAFWYSSFENSAKDFFTKAKFLKRDLAEGKKPEVRVMNDVIQAYNRMVNDSNTLRFK